MQKYFKYINTLIFTSFVIIGCEGEIGKDGVNRIPDDVQSPTIEIILPEGSRTVYDKVAFEALAYDDIGVEKVELLIDGQEPASGELTINSPPWQTILDISNLEDGVHYLQARAVDGSGHEGLSTMVLLRKMDVSEKPTFHRLKSFLEIDENEQMGWALPDREGIFSSYGTRFIPDGPCIINQFAVKFFTYEDWPCTRPISFEIRSSRDNLPDSLLYADTTNWVGRRSDPPGGLKWINFNIHESIIGRKIQAEGDFFIVVNLADEQVGDTIAVLTDDGQWRNYHGVVEEDGEWKPFMIDSRFVFNPLIWANVKYE